MPKSAEKRVSCFYRKSSKRVKRSTLKRVLRVGWIICYVRLLVELSNIFVVCYGFQRTAQARYDIKGNSKSSREDKYGTFPGQDKRAFNRTTEIENCRRIT